MRELEWRIVEYRGNTGSVFFILIPLVHLRLIESFKSAETRERGEREVWVKRVKRTALHW